ncbi:MAG: pilus assembly FimT family protein [Thermodesulfobacteriota bacterium]
MRKQMGFTLIEIVVVVFILGSLFLIAAPKLLEKTDINLKSASRTLTGTIKYLYNEAVFKKNIYRLTFDIDSGQYWPEVLEGNQFLKRDDIVFRTKKLPDGVSFADIQTERTRGKIDSGSDVFIIFLPTGFVDPAVIHLKTGNDNFFTLSTNPYTGITKVFDQYVEFIN